MWTKEKQSDVMSKIGSKNTKPKLILRPPLFKKRFKFRAHLKDLPDKLDIVLTNKISDCRFCSWVFLYYHKDCREGQILSTNPDFWKTNLKLLPEKFSYSYLHCKSQNIVPMSLLKVLPTWKYL